MEGGDSPPPAYSAANVDPGPPKSGGRAQIQLRQCPDSFACIFTFFFFFTHDKVFGNRLNSAVLLPAVKSKLSVKNCTAASFQNWDSFCSNQYITSTASVAHIYQAVTLAHQLSSSPLQSAVSTNTQVFAWIHRLF
jgi:hypothetical protein